MQPKINLYDHDYEEGQEIQIQGILITKILKVLEAVKEAESHEVLLTNIPKSATEWKEASPKEFFTQKPILGYTRLGAAALDLEYVLANLHYKNIQDQIAKPIEELFPKFKQTTDETEASTNDTDSSATDNVPQSASDGNKE